MGDGVLNSTCILKPVAEVVTVDFFTYPLFRVTGYSLGGEFVTKWICISPSGKKLGYFVLTNMQACILMWRPDMMREHSQSWAVPAWIISTSPTWPLRSFWPFLSWGPWLLTPHQLLTLCGLHQPGSNLLFQTQMVIIPQCMVRSGF